MIYISLFSEHRTDKVVGFIMADLARIMSSKQLAQAQEIIDTVQGKMRKVVDEFAQGDISREQFQEIYEHYQNQIMMAVQMAAEADATVDGLQLTPGETFAIRSKLVAKAKGMTIYYHATGLLLETLGDFDISVAKIAPCLNSICDQVHRGRTADVRTEKMADEWVLYVPGRYSTAVMLFSHEPSVRQISVIENIHRDFETANYTALKSGHADGSKLVYPFKSFVRRSVGR